VFSEQRIRKALFYLSLLIFLSGLPFILSFAMGYIFDVRTLKFTKTGLVDLETQPQGAIVYLNKVLLKEKTPATIRELLPGTYNINLELENHYPWVRDVRVEAGKVTRLDKIILFPLRPNVKQMNKDKISSFWLDLDRGRIYYLDDEEKAIYRSDLEGEDFERVGSFPGINFPVKEWKVSPDREKLVCFNPRKIAVVYLNPKPNLPSAQAAPLMLENPNRRITNVFWHSDSYHLVLITDRNIEVQETILKSQPINLVDLNTRNVPVFYDDTKDVLYFLDSERAPDGKYYDNVYKLEIGAKFSPFQGLINQGPGE